MSAKRSRKIMLRLVLVFSMLVTMVPWASVNASEGLTDEELFEAYEKFAYVARNDSIGYHSMDELVFNYLKATDEMEAYLDTESGYYTISYDDYMNLVYSTFDSDYLSDMMEYLVSNGYIDTETNIITFDDSESDDLFWMIPTHVYRARIEIAVSGLILDGTNVYDESEIASLTEFVDYVELYYSEEEGRTRIAEEDEEGWYVGISDFSTLYFSKEGKITYYNTTDHYTYNNCRYNYDYEGNFIEKRVLVNVNGDVSFRYAGDSASDLEDSLERYSDADGYWAVLGSKIDFQLIAQGYINSVQKVTYENSDGSNVLNPSEDGVYTITVSDINSTLDVDVVEDYEINDGVLTCRHLDYPTWYELKIDLDEHVKMRTNGGVRFYLDDKLYIASSENKGSAAWTFTADEGYEVVSIELADPSAGTISSGNWIDCYLIALNAPTTLIVRTEKSANNVTDVFVDVNEDDWYTEAVQYVYDHGIMSGNDNVFDPLGDMTRAMMVSTLYRQASSPEVTDYTATSIFGDVYSGAWFEDAVNWAYNEGISVGYPDIMQFGAYDSVTREQLASLLYRYADKNGYEVNAREDLTDYIGYSEISEYAKDSMSWAVSIGVISGIRSDVDGVVTYDLAPQGYATRAQLASILMRFCEYYGL